MVSAGLWEVSKAGGPKSVACLSWRPGGGGGSADRTSRAASCREIVVVLSISAGFFAAVCSDSRSLRSPLASYLCYPFQTAPVICIWCLVGRV